MQDENLLLTKTLAQFRKQALQCMLGFILQSSLNGISF